MKVSLMNVHTGWYQAYGLELIQLEFGDYDRSLLCLLYDGFGKRLFINILFFKLIIKFKL